MRLKLDVAKAVMLASVAIGLGARPLAAQNSTTTAPPSSTEIGPGELSNFTLNGTVTRPAGRPPAAQPAPPPATQAPSGNAPTASTTNRPAASTAARPPAAARTDPADSDLFRRPPTLPDASAANAVIAAPLNQPPSQPTVVPPPSTDGFSLLPWIVALLAVAGAGVMFFGRRRQQRYATAGEAPVDIVRPTQRPDPVPRPAPRPDPVPRAVPEAPAGGARRPLPTTLMPPAPSRSPAPAAQPRQERAPDPVIPGGIVSTGLRPWIDVELNADRALLDEDGAAIAFEVTLFNSGSAAARDVSIEARLMNAGTNQDVELSAFFTNDTAPGDPIPQIVPYARIPLRSAVRLSRADIREYEIDGRKLFVPMVAISVRYRWSGGIGHSAAGFLIGQGAEGHEKLAPLRLDRGSRSWQGLGVRRYEKGLRS